MEGELSALQEDALRELGNIGAGNATTALSQLLGDQRIRMVSPAVRVVALSELTDRYGPPESLVTGICVGIRQGLAGHLVLLLDTPSAQQLAEALLEMTGVAAKHGGRAAPAGALSSPEAAPGAAPGLDSPPWPAPDAPPPERGPSDLRLSALLELGNIAVSAYLNALADLTGLVLVPSVPWLAQDMLAAVLNSLLAEIGLSDDAVLVIETEFAGERFAIGGRILLIPARGQLKRLLEAVGLGGAQ